VQALSKQHDTGDHRESCSPSSGSRVDKRNITSPVRGTEPYEVEDLDKAGCARKRVGAESESWPTEYEPSRKSEWCREDG